MEIVDLSPELEVPYLTCLKDPWSEALDASDRKRPWLADRLEKGLRVKLAIDTDAKPAGLIQYRPIGYGFFWMSVPGRIQATPLRDRPYRRPRRLPSANQLRHSDWPEARPAKDGGCA